MPLLELPCVLALIFVWSWTCVEAVVRAGRPTPWALLGLFCSPIVLVVMFFPVLDPETGEEKELPPMGDRVRAAMWMSALQCGALGALTVYFALRV